jgi:hypothetical protein
MTESLLGITKRLSQMQPSKTPDVFEELFSSQQVNAEMNVNALCEATKKLADSPKQYAHYKGEIMDVISDLLAVVREINGGSNVQ